MHHNPLQERIFAYCTEHTSPVQSVLNELERASHLKTLSPQMVSGPYQGMLLQFISQMIHPHRVLEIGSFTGYSAICLAQGLAEGGEVHTIEVNDELAYLIREHLEKAGLVDRVKLLIGDAGLILPTLTDVYDLVFMDAGKLDYALHYELALGKVRSGGFIIADNVLWDSKVVTSDQEATTVALRQFNDTVLSDERVENLLLPLRDGLMLIRKR
jgi:caffeoyl-CoA O-methyltransferase